MRDIVYIILTFLFILGSFIVVFFIIFSFLKDLICFVCFKIVDAFQKKLIYMPYTSDGIRVTSGFIYKKKIISRKSYYIFDHEFIRPEIYRFFILHYDKNFSFDVSEATYYMYSIGDWFDSRFNSQNP